MECYELTCNGFENPIQIDSSEIFFCWKLRSNIDGAKQSAYQIIVFNDENTLWDTKKVASSQSQYIMYKGPDLAADSHYYWQVTVWDQNNYISETKRAFFQTGLMGNWKAQWIGYDKIIGRPFDRKKPFYCADEFEKGKNEYYLPPVPYLRKEFCVEKKVERAKIYVSAFGLVQVYVNGKQAGTEYLVPGIADYRKYVYSKAWDITDQIRIGKNVIGIQLADGWYAGYMGLNNREWYGSCPRVLLQLALAYNNHKKEYICTDKSWKAAYGAILEADIFQGEMQDARLEPSGWLEDGFDDTGWDEVEEGAEYDHSPTAHMGEPIIEYGSVKPQSIIQLTENTKQIFFSKYVCGVIRFRLKGSGGSKLTVKHAEMLDENGRLYLKGNRSARCQDTYILRGDGEEIFQPIFTHHGFRYAEITLMGDVKILSIEGIQIGSRLNNLSEFECDNETINHVFEMVRSTEKANMLDVPTDCSARDERLGWGLEGNHFMYAMGYMNDQYHLIQKWNHDIWMGQKRDGSLGAIAPEVGMPDIEIFIGDLQSNFGIHMVYALYKLYGDINSIEIYYRQMTAFMDYLDRNSDRNIRYAVGKDWIGILENTGHTDLLHGYGDCSSTLIGTTHYAVVVSMMREMAAAVHKWEDVEKYASRWINIKKAFNRKFIQRDGTIRNGKQAEYLMAIAAELLNEEDTEKAVNWLENDMKKDGHIIWKGGSSTTGYLLPALERLHREDLSNEFLSESKYPSIGYMWNKGYDTLWERWDAIWEDGSIHPQVMNGVSHDAYTVVGQYLISGLVGIDLLEPGFKKLKISPGPSKEVKRCHGKLYTGYGPVDVSWKLDGNIFKLNCEIPANTEAIAEIPCTNEDSLCVRTGMAEKISCMGKRLILKLSSGICIIETQYII